MRRALDSGFKYSFQKRKGAARGIADGPSFSMRLTKYSSDVVRPPLSHRHTGQGQFFTNQAKPRPQYEKERGKLLGGGDELGALDVTHSNARHESHAKATGAGIVVNILGQHDRKARVGVGHLRDGPVV